MDGMSVYFIDNTLFLEKKEKEKNNVVDRTRESEL